MYNTEDTGTRLVRRGQWQCNPGKITIELDDDHDYTILQKTPMGPRKPGPPPMDGGNKLQLTIDIQRTIINYGPTGNVSKRRSPRDRWNITSQQHL
eukprot:scaffold109876_cov55-Attheya_sp.AAC.2